MKKLPICKNYILRIFNTTLFYSKFFTYYILNKAKKKHLFELAGQNFLVISIKTNTKIRVAM